MSSIRSASAGTIRERAGKAVGVMVLQCLDIEVLEEGTDNCVGGAFCRQNISRIDTGKVILASLTLRRAYSSVILASTSLLWCRFWAAVAGTSLLAPAQFSFSDLVLSLSSASA